MKIHDLTRWISIFGEIHLISITRFTGEETETQCSLVSDDKPRLLGVLPAHTACVKAAPAEERGPRAAWGRAAGGSSTRFCEMWPVCWLQGWRGRQQGNFLSLLLPLLHRLCPSSPSAPPHQHLPPLRGIPAKRHACGLLDRHSCCGASFGGTLCCLGEERTMPHP